MVTIIKILNTDNGIVAINNQGQSTINISYNNIKSNYGVMNLFPVTYEHVYNSFATVNYNNFDCSIYLLKTTSYFHGGEIVYLDATNNWFGTTNEEEIDPLIFDRDDLDPNHPSYPYQLGIWVYTPFLNHIGQKAGIIF